MKTARLVKAAREIRAIERASRITDRAFQQFARSDVRIGRSEIQIRNALSSRLTAAGARGRAFPIVVAFGRNAANPHHKPGTARLKNNQAILVDVGATFRGYCSDMTRMLFVGRPSTNFLARYRLVLRAQNTAIKKARPGMRGQALDLITRSIIDTAGFRRRFIHTTGHGIGRKVHEQLEIGPKSKTVLKPGMTFTIEPGIYDKRWGGIRIEDTVVMTKQGVRTLTKTPKHLIVLETTR